MIRSSTVWSSLICNSVLFLVNALLPLRGRLVGPVTGTDSAGVPTNYHGSTTYSGNEPPFEMQTRNAGYTTGNSVNPTLANGTSNTGGHVLDGSNTNMVGTVDGNTFVPTPPGQHKGVLGMEDRRNMI